MATNKERQSKNLYSKKEAVFFLYGKITKKEIIKRLSLGAKKKIRIEKSLFLIKIKTTVLVKIKQL